MKLIGKYSIASALRWLLGVANVFVVIGGVLTLILFAFALADPSLGAGLLDGMEGRPADPSHILTGAAPWSFSAAPWRAASPGGS